MAWQTPNEPDGITMQRTTCLRGNSVMAAVSWKDPESGEWYLMVGYGGETHEELERQVRLWLFRAYGDLVIKPEHRGEEFG